MIKNIQYELILVEEKMTSIKNTLKHINKNSFRTLIGLAGVDSEESVQAKKIANYFEWLMLLLVVWLPFQWYFLAHHTLSSGIATIDNWIIWFAFFLQTITMTYFVRYKIHYLLTNWLSLAIIILGCPFVWVYFPHAAVNFRIIFLLVMIAIIVPWLSMARHFLLRNHLGTTLLVFVITTILAGLLISFTEPGISNPLQGIWWAFQTVTTIGYGDTVPITLLGRIVAIVVMLLGIGLFSLLTANFSSFLIAKDEKKQAQNLEEIKKSILEISLKIKKIEKDVQALRYDRINENKVH